MRLAKTCMAVADAGGYRACGSLPQRTAAPGRSAIGRGSRYAGSVARGWESKAIESQQDDARATGPTGPTASPDEVARRQKAESIALVLADTTAQLQAACRPLHRDMLRQRIAALEALLAEVAPMAPRRQP